MGTGLVGDRLRDEGLPRPGRAVEKDPLGWGDGEPVEQFGMLEREFDHLPDSAELLTEPPDVLVGDPWRRDLGLADRLLLDGDDGGRRDLHDPLRLRAHHHERERAAHQEDTRDDEDIPADERSTCERLLDEALEPRPEVHPRRPGVDRGDRDRVGVRAVDLLDEDAVTDADTGVTPQDRLEADPALALVVGRSSGHERWSALASADLDHIPDADLQSLAGLAVDAGDPEAHVLLGDLGDSKVDRLDHRWSHHGGTRYIECRGSGSGGADRQISPRALPPAGWEWPRTRRSCVTCSRPQATG